jgi:hypothetical protein
VSFQFGAEIGAHVAFQMTAQNAHGVGAAEISWRLAAGMLGERRP